MAGLFWKQLKPCYWEKSLKQTFKYLNRTLVPLNPHLPFAEFLCLARDMQIMQVNFNFPNKQIKMIVGQLIFSIRQEPFLPLARRHPSWHPEALQQQNNVEELDKKMHFHVTCHKSNELKIAISAFKKNTFFKKLSSDLRLWQNKGKFPPLLFHSISR